MKKAPLDSAKEIHPLPPPGVEGHPRIAIFYELGSVNKLAGVLNTTS